MSVTGVISNSMADYYDKNCFGTPTKLLISSDMLDILSDEIGSDISNLTTYHGLSIIIVSNRKGYIEVC